MVSMLANTPWVQFNPLSLMNTNKGVFGVNRLHMLGEVDRARGWVDQLMGLWDSGAIKPKIVGFSSSTKPRRLIISFRTARTLARCCLRLKASD